MIQLLVGALVLIGISAAINLAYDRALQAAFDRASRTVRQWGESDLTPEQRRRLDVGPTAPKAGPDPQKTS